MGVTSSVFEGVRLSASELRKVSKRTMDELRFELVEYPISFADFTTTSKIQRYFIVEQKMAELDAEHELEYEQIVKFADKITTSDKHVCYILKVFYRLIVGSSLFEQAMQGEKGIADEAPGFDRDKPGYLDITNLVGMDLKMKLSFLISRTF